jgi:NAD-dependent deacetylase
MYMRKSSTVIHRPPNILFFTGAGLSADSGMPTFHGAGGLHCRPTSAAAALSARLSASDPSALNAFCDDLRASLADLRPNAAHEAIATLKREFGERLVHFTQNFDDLCERAGEEGVVHVHGRITRMRALDDPSDTVEIGHRRYWAGASGQAHERGFRFRSPSGSLYRPDIVLFGEEAPLYAPMREAIDRLREQDVAVVIGTRGEVVRIFEMLRWSRCRKVLNNLHRSEFIDDRLFDRVYRCPAAEAASRIVDFVRMHASRPETNAGLRAA